MRILVAVEPADLRKALTGCPPCAGKNYRGRACNANTRHGLQKLRARSLKKRRLRMAGCGSSCIRHDHLSKPRKSSLFTAGESVFEPGWRCLVEDQHLLATLDNHKSRSARGAVREIAGPLLFLGQSHSVNPAVCMPAIQRGIPRRRQQPLCTACRSACRSSAHRSVRLA